MAGENGYQLPGFFQFFWSEPGAVPDGTEAVAEGTELLVISGKACVMIGVAMIVKPSGERYKVCDCTQLLWMLLGTLLCAALRSFTKDGAVGVKVSARHS